MGGLELAILVKQDLLLADRKNEQASVASDREKEFLVRTDHYFIYLSRMHAKLLKERGGEGRLNSKRICEDLQASFVSTSNETSYSFDLRAYRWTLSFYVSDLCVFRRSIFYKALAAMMLDNVKSRYE